MVRLTQKEASGKWQVRGVPWEQLHEGAVITKETSQILYMCLCKLQDYEDSGLSPDQLETRKYELEDMMAQVCDKLCRHPREIAVQEELDEVCGDCPINVCRDRIFASKPAEDERRLSCTSATGKECHVGGQQKDG